jgi:hypothetical protein
MLVVDNVIFTQFHQRGMAGKEAVKGDKIWNEPL